MGNFLFDRHGYRKYLTPDERQRFLAACETAPEEARTFGLTLAYTGCRISEALNMSKERVDLEARCIVFETLKQRRRGVFRAVPVPERLLIALDEVHGIAQASAEPSALLWAIGRTTAWRYIRSIMAAAQVFGPHSNPKGLRHAFGVAAVQRQVPITMIKKWLGHTRLETTAIYLDAVGEEERAIAERLWDNS